jgi:hypothetical protein
MKKNSVNLAQNLTQKPVFDNNTSEENESDFEVDYGFSPFMKAAEVGNLDIIKRFYMKGHDIDEPEIEGVTPLMIGKLFKILKFH